MRTSSLTTGAVVATVLSGVLTGCSALANQEAREAASQATAQSETTIAAPRTDATTPAPIPPPTDPAAQAIGPVSFQLAEKGDLGTILVDGSGYTVYAFDREPADQPTCYDACAETWKPVLAESDPAGGIGIDVAAARTVQRRDGAEQATYKGHPLYRYAGDSGDRDANGHGLDLFGGEWHVLTRDGQPLRDAPAAGAADGYTPTGTRSPVDGACISLRSAVKSEIVLVATVATGRASRPVASLLETITTLST